MMMAKLIKLKNAFKGNVTDVIYVNADKVYTIFEQLKTSDDNELKTVTTLYCGNEGSWDVENTLSEVIKKLNDNETIQDGMNTHFNRAIKDSKKIADLKKL